MKKQPAFTLVELMIAMAIIAILATAGTLAYTDYVKKSRDSARGQIAQNLNSSVMAYAASNGGNPPGKDDFTEFLASAGETFGGGGVSGGGSLSLIDPVGGKDVCLDAIGTPNQPCRFDYTAYNDGTYAISYGVEHQSSREGNFYKTAISTTDPVDPNKEIVKYGVYIGSAPYIGSPPTKATDAVSQASVQSVDKNYIPSGENTPRSLVVDFRPRRLDIVSGSSGGTSSWGIVCGVTHCNEGQGCVGGVCKNACGASGIFCTSEQICLNNSSCEAVDPCLRTTAQAGDTCLDQTKYVTATLRTTASDAGTMQWSTETVYRGANSTSDGEANTSHIMEYSNGSNYPAAEYCAGLSFGDHDDWYLPSTTELGSMFANKTKIGGFAPTWSWYWSSTEFNDRYVRRMVNSSLLIQVEHKTASQGVRCVRRP